MNNYEIFTLPNLLRDNAYAGRGIVVGKSANGKYAVSAYFIMGRSDNSRNRIFEWRDGALFTAPYDLSRVEDPSLIIYAAVRTYENKLILTNGDQTDTIYEGLCSGKSFSDSLRSRKFEPDAPNLTPRISSCLTFENSDFTYEMSILKSADADGSATNRYTFSYEPLAGLGHFIHTYVCDGNPLPTFLGEPERVAIGDDIDTFTDELWTALNADNRISLFVRYTDLESGEVCDKIINKHGN